MAYAVKPAPKKPDMSLRPKTFTRPKPTKPIVPVIPGTDRNQPDKFFLEHADLIYNNEEADTASGRQVVSGNVVFRKMGTYLYCDSAYYFPETASMDAFGNVRLLQGDTLEVKADYIYYDGLQQLARLRTAGRGKEVSLEHTSRGDGTRNICTPIRLTMTCVTNLHISITVAACITKTCVPGHVIPSHLLRGSIRRVPRWRR